MSSLWPQVTGSNHRYLLKIEEREEGGTPAIVGCIRAGLAFQVKQVSMNKHSIR